MWWTEIHMKCRRLFRLSGNWYIHIYKSICKYFINYKFIIVDFLNFFYLKSLFAYKKYKEYTILIKKTYANNKD